MFCGVFALSGGTTSDYLGTEAAIVSLANPSPCQVLNSHDDWAALVLPVGTSSNFDAFVHIDVSEEEMTTPLLEYLNETIVQPPPLCPPSDLNCDGSVNAYDLALLLSVWGTPLPTTADLSDDGAVGAFDLAILLASWGPYQ